MAYNPLAQVSYMQAGAPLQYAAGPTVQYAAVAPQIGHTTFAQPMMLPVQQTVVPAQQTVVPAQQQVSYNSSRPTYQKLAEEAAEAFAEELLEDELYDQESVISEPWSRPRYTHQEEYYREAPRYPDYGLPQQPRYALQNTDLPNFAKWLSYRIRGNEGHADDVITGQAGHYNMDSRQLDPEARVDALEYARDPQGKTSLDSEYFVRYGIPRVLNRFQESKTGEKSVMDEPSPEEMDEFMRWVKWRVALNNDLGTKRDYDVDTQGLQAPSRFNALRYTRGGVSDSSLQADLFLQYGLPRVVERGVQQPQNVVGTVSQAGGEYTQIQDNLKKEKKKKLVRKVREVKVNYDQYLETAINHALEYYYKNQNYYNNYLSELATTYQQEQPTILDAGEKPIEQKLQQLSIGAPKSEIACSSGEPIVLPVPNPASLGFPAKATVGPAVVVGATSVASSVRPPRHAASLRSVEPVASVPSLRPVASLRSVESVESAHSGGPAASLRSAEPVPSVRSAGVNSVVRSEVLDQAIVIKTGVDPPIQPPIYKNAYDQGFSQQQANFFYTTQFPNAEAALTKEYTLEPLNQNFSTVGSSRSSTSTHKTGSSRVSDELKEILAAK